MYSFELLGNPKDTIVYREYINIWLLLDVLFYLKMDDQQRSPSVGNVQRPSAEMPLETSVSKWRIPKQI